MMQLSSTSYYDTALLLFEIGCFLSWKADDDDDDDDDDIILPKDNNLISHSFFFHSSQSQVSEISHRISQHVVIEIRRSMFSKDIFLNCRL